MPRAVFFSCKMPEKLTRKVNPEVCGWLLRPIFNPEKKPIFKQEFTCMLSHLEAAFATRIVCSRGSVHMNKDKQIGS